MSGVLRRAPWFALLLAGCEALSGRAPASEPGPAQAQAQAGSEPAIASPAALKAVVAAGIRRRGENEASYEVDAFVAALVVEELTSGAGGGVKVEPAVADGAQVGYRLVEVAPGSAYAQVGLRAGDVIEAIGEARLDGPGRAAELLGSLGSGARLAVVRDGVGFSLELRVAGGLAWSQLLGARTGAELVAPGVSAGTGPIEHVLRDMPAGQGAEGQGALEALEARPRDGAPGGTPVLPAGKPASSSSGSGGGGTSVAKAGGSGGSGAKAGGSSGSAGSGSSAGATGVQCASTTSCTLDRKLFDAAVANPSQLTTQASISPVRGGYKLTRVSPGSTVAALGFRAGDVIVSVNGARLDDEVAALGLYMGLGSTRSYNVTYERNGARATKTIALR